MILPFKNKMQTFIIYQIIYFMTSNLTLQLLFVIIIYILELIFYRYSSFDIIVLFTSLMEKKIFSFHSVFMLLYFCRCVIIVLLL